MLFAPAAAALPPADGWLFGSLRLLLERPVLTLALSLLLLESACRLAFTNFWSSSALAWRRFSSWYSSMGLVTMPVMQPAMSTAVDVTAEAPPLMGSHLVTSIVRGFDW